MELLKEAVQKFHKTQGVIRIVAHMGTDGICATAILLKALQRLDRPFVVSVVKQLTPDYLQELNREEYSCIFFLDLGSESIMFIQHTFRDKTIFIFDHHEIGVGDKKGLVHINPLEHGIDGTKEIATGGLVYFFCKLLDEKNKESSYLALVGAVGDLQENNGFLGLNQEILNECNTLKVKEGIKAYGASTRSLVSFLEYSVDPFIPGITGDRQKVVQLLRELELVSLRETKLIDLDEVSLKKLTSAIVSRCKVDKARVNARGKNYLIPLKKGEVMDIREFSTLLNAASRLHHPSKGIALCLHEDLHKDKILDILFNYELEIINCLNWFYAHYKDKEVVTHGEGFLIVKAEEHIRDTLIGTINTVIAMSGICMPGTLLFFMAHTIEGNSKVSLRMSQYKEEVNLKELLGSLVEGLNATLGGHSFAAGALISQDQEEAFIIRVQEVLSKTIIEEKIK